MTRHGWVPSFSARSAKNVNSANVVTLEENRDKLGVIQVDPGLATYQTHLNHRFQQYLQRKGDIQKYEGGLENFSKGAVHSWLLFM